MKWATAARQNPLSEQRQVVLGKFPYRPFNKEIFKHNPVLFQCFDRYFSLAKFKEFPEGLRVVVPTSFHQRGVEKYKKDLEELFHRKIISIELGDKDLLNTQLELPQSSKGTTPRTPSTSPVCPPLPTPTTLPSAKQYQQPQVHLNLPPRRSPLQANQLHQEQRNRKKPPLFIASNAYQVPYKLVYNWCLNINNKDRTQALWVYGDSGSGKSNLIRQLNKWIQLDKKLVVIDVVNFFHEWRHSLETRTHLDFAKKYRKQADVFVLENIDFLQNKKATQDEVLFTVNALLERGANVAVTSSLDPIQMREILNPALYSRLMGGMTLELPGPDREFKEKLWRYLLKTHNLDNLDVDLRCQERLIQIKLPTARKIKSLFINAVGRLSLKGQLSDKDLGELEAQHAPPMLNKKTSKRPYEVMETVATLCGVSIGTIQGPVRRSDITIARRFVFLALSRYLGLTNCMIAKLCEKDPSTVCHALKTVEEELDSKRHIREQWNWISAKLGFHPPKGPSSC